MNWRPRPPTPARCRRRSCGFVTNPAAALLLAVFVGANFVAATFLTWLPLYIFEKFELDLADSSLISTVWPLASLAGALGGGVAADWAARRSRGRADPDPEPRPDPGRSVRLPDRISRRGSPWSSRP